MNRILVDGGSRVNILSIHTMKKLGISTIDLSEIFLMIQGFNQGGQWVMGANNVDLTIREPQSGIWLHVIDAKISYNILHGRPWVYENKFVLSTYHQCLKYYEDRVEKKYCKHNPFIEVETHFASAKFHLKKYAIN